MTKFTRILSTGILSVANVFSSSLAVAQSEPVESAVDSAASDAFIARGGVIVTVSAMSMVSGVVGAGFKQLGTERARDSISELGKVTATDSALSQRVMAGTRPGDIIRFEFIPATPRALQYASDDLKNVVDVWAERVKNLDVQKASLATDIENVKHGFVNVVPDGQPMKLGAGAQAKRLAYLQNELADTDKMLAKAHLKLGEQRAQYMTTHSALDLTNSHRGVVRASRIVIELPVQYNMPITTDYTLSRILAFDETTKARGVVPSVRLQRFNAKATNMSMQSMRIARRGFVGVAAGIVIVLEELTVGAIANNMAKDASMHFAPAIRTEPASKNP